MNVKRLFILTAWLAGWWLLVGLGPVSGQQAPPTENKGVKIDALATMTQYEQHTYEQWLSHPQNILEILKKYFHAERLSFRWGKLLFVGRKA